MLFLRISAQFFRVYNTQMCVIFSLTLLIPEMIYIASPFWAIIITISDHDLLSSAVAPVVFAQHNKNFTCIGCRLTFYLLRCSSVSSLCVYFMRPTLNVFIACIYNSMSRRALFLQQFVVTSELRRKNQKIKGKKLHQKMHKIEEPVAAATPPLIFMGNTHTSEQCSPL